MQDCSFGPPFLRADLVRGAQAMCRCASLIPPWNLEVVLSALKKPPYEPIESADIRALTLKTVFLVALTSARRVSEIHALRADSVSLSNATVTMFTDPAFLPKVATSWHCSQPIVLPIMHADFDLGLRSLRRCHSCSSVTEHVTRENQYRRLASQPGLSWLC